MKMMDNNDDDDDDDEDDVDDDDDADADDYDNEDVALVVAGGGLRCGTAAGQTQERHGRSNGEGVLRQPWA